MGAVVKDSHLTFNGISYFRGNATAIQFGSYGRKKTPLFGMHYLEVDGQLPVSTPIAPAVIADIDTTASSQGDVTLNMSVAAGTVSGGASGQWAAAQSHTLKLVQFVMDLGTVKSLVAGNANALASMRDNKNTGRVAYQVWVVMTATEASKFTGSVSLNATATINGVKITATSTVSGGTTSTVTVNAGSTYAYLLAKPKWSGSNPSSWTTDEWG